jgi:large subunit ribosomal protein L5
MNRLRKKYQEEIKPELTRELKLVNSLSAPELKKVVVNIGITEDQHQDQALQNVSEQFAAITGQKPKITVAKKSIAGFKLRAGDPVGLTVTLRGDRMYQFTDKLITIALPRVKDFQGVKQNAFDQSGNYSLGLEEQIVFPEIDYDKIDKVRGFQINFVIKAQDKDAAKLLLTKLGMPFEKDN